MESARFMLLALVAVAAPMAAAGPTRALLAMNTDRTLPTAGQTCLDSFDQIMTEQYNDTRCPDLIKQAMSGTSESTCPPGGAGEGSDVQKCMSQNQVCFFQAVRRVHPHDTSPPPVDAVAVLASPPPQETIDAWTSFIKVCEVLNVANVSI